MSGITHPYVACPTVDKTSTLVSTNPLLLTCYVTTKWQDSIKGVRADQSNNVKLEYPD